MSKRYLSKSRFKTGHECATKLFYTGKKDYANLNDENEFLKSLAEGGYQVGELAKLYYPDGVEPTERDYEKSHAITAGLLSSETKNIYEASILFQNLFARIDILHRTSTKSFDLIEVKAKSFDSTDEDPFWNKVDKKKNVFNLKASWEPYLYDVAFQTMVARKAFPDFTFTPYLLLADKNVMSTVNGLNQLFPITRTKNNQIIVKRPEKVSPELLGEEVLTQIDVSDVVEHILTKSKNGPDEKCFPDYVSFLADLYEQNTKQTPTPSSTCKGCEFYGDEDQRAAGLKSGFHECWKQAFKTTEKELDQDLVTDLWFFRDSNLALQNGKFLLKDLPDSMIKITESVDGALTRSERQLLQLTKVKNNDSSIFMNKDAIHAEMQSWKYPLHFIDFETMAVAIPFHRGQRPYESIAFQFSHHQMEKDGSYHHRDEYLHRETGKLPNFDFVRELRSAIGNDEGTIFRYTSHENTILNHIHRQLEISSEPDKKDLMNFLESITQKSAKDKSDTGRRGDRNMVDLFKILTQYYYDPSTHGSNSLKEVFPAILRRSRFLQEKYSKPVYGTSTIGSKNFENKTWITRDSKGEIINPYHTLPPIFETMDFEQAERFFSNADIKEGGSASIAFARMQFEQMSTIERDAIRASLLRYCELDTLAMVMLVEHWRE